MLVAWRSLGDDKLALELLPSEGLVLAVLLVYVQSAIAK